MLEEALKYFELGYTPIPIKWGSKKAITKWEKYQHTKPVKQELIDWFGNGNKRNIAIVTGESSKVIVLDIDNKKRTKEILGELTNDTLTVQTPSGGLHVYFRLPDYPCKSYKHMEHGREIFSLRADGMYVLVPPSWLDPKLPENREVIHEHYKWTSSNFNNLRPLPDNLIQLITGFTDAKKNYNNEYDKLNDSLKGYICDLKSKIKISGLAEDLGFNRVKRYTDYVLYNCKFHPPDKTPSFSIMDSYGIARDFHDDKSYDHIELVKKIKNLDFKGAIDFLSDHVGVEGYDWKEANRKFNGHSDSFKQKLEVFKVQYPKPLSEEAYHGYIGGYLRLVEPHTEADPVALLVNLLTGFGNILIKPKIAIGADNHFPKLFVVIVGDTSKGRKGMSWNMAKSILKDVDGEWTNRIFTGLSTGEGLIWVVRDPIYKKKPIREKKKIVGYEDVMEDEGVSDKRAIIFEPEFARTLKVISREGNTLSAVLRSAWDAGNLQILTKTSQAKTASSHISILAHITSNELKKLLNETECFNGFANRFIFICTKRSKYLPFGGTLSEREYQPLISKLTDIVEYCKSNIEHITWAEETKPLWERVYTNLSDGKMGVVGSILARAEAQVLRIACIYALLDKSNQIMPEHLNASLAVWDYSEASIKYIFQDATGNKIANQIMKLLNDNTDGVSRTQINNYFQRHRTSDDIKTALELLEQLGYATKTKYETNGRPRETWTLNKAFCAQEA